MEKERTRSFSLTLTPSTMERLRIEAEKANRSLSSYINILLTDFAKSLDKRNVRKM